MLRNLTGEQVVKEKQSSLVATVSAMESDGMLNDVTPTVEKEKQSSLEDTTGLGSFPPLPTQVNTSAGTLSKSSYANAAVESIRADSVNLFANQLMVYFLWKRSIDGLDAMFENCPWFIRNNPLILKKWHPEENVLKEDVGTVLVWVKLYGVPVTAFSEDGLSAIATKLGRSDMQELMINFKPDVELKDNIGAHLVRFLDTFMRNVQRIQFGTNGRTSNLGNNNATPSGSSFMNINNDGEFASNTPIVEKIDKIEQQISKGKLRDSYSNNDDYDPNDDDMYENQDLSEHLQFICDNLDITVCGKKKK
ncbi:ribonuclease H-like domain-containing protein [Tanacetum coccineum]